MPLPVRLVWVCGVSAFLQETVDPQPWRHVFHGEQVGFPRDRAVQGVVCLQAEGIKAAYIARVSSAPVMMVDQLLKLAVAEQRRDVIQESVGCVDILAAAVVVELFDQAAELVSAQAHLLGAGR